GAGGPKSWASMLCSKNAMVIEFSSGDDSAPEHARGQVTVTQGTNRPPTSRIIVGDPRARKQIEDRAKEPGNPAHTPLTQ
ncbi:hypothetical protein, partial [Streptomyces sp. NPDC002587]